MISNLESLQPSLLNIPPYIGAFEAGSLYGTWTCLKMITTELCPTKVSFKMDWSMSSTTPHSNTVCACKLYLNIPSYHQMLQNGPSPSKWSGFSLYTIIFPSLAWYFVRDGRLINSGPRIDYCSICPIAGWHPKTVMYWRSTRTFGSKTVSSQYGLKVSLPR